MKTADGGTGGISHTVHVGYGGPEDDDEVFENIEEFDNVVDVMNLPNGAVKFTHEGGLEMINGARIIRSRVTGLDDAVRYRCIECESPESDMISSNDRGAAISARCPVCEEEQSHKSMDINEI